MFFDNLPESLKKTVATVFVLAENNIDNEEAFADKVFDYLIDKYKTEKIKDFDGESYAPETA